MIRCNINFNPFATTIIVALHEMLRIVRYDPSYRMSFSVFIINFFFFCSINTSFFQSNLEFLEHRAHFSCGVARSERIKDKTRSQGLTYVLRVSRISFGYPQSRFSNRLYMERGGGLARSSRENPVARKGCIRSTRCSFTLFCIVSLVSSPGWLIVFESRRIEYKRHARQYIVSFYSKNWSIVFSASFASFVESSIHSVLKNFRLF